MPKSAAALSLCAFFGCASAETFRSSTKTYPRVPQDQVLLFFDEADIKGPYEVVGEIMMSGSSGWGVDCNDLVKKAQKKAAEMGANAIIAQDCDAVSSGKRVTAALFGTEDNKTRARAIRILAQPARVAGPHEAKPAGEKAEGAGSPSFGRHDSATRRSLRVRVVTDPPDATVSVDGLKVGSTRESGLSLVLDHAAPMLVIEKPGYETVTRQVEPSGDGSEVVVVVKLRPAS